MTLGSRIAALRAAKGLSQEELAQRMEVSRQSVSKWETDGSVPELDKLLRLSEVFGVSLDSLVKDAQPQPEAAPGSVAPPAEDLPVFCRENLRVILGSAVVLFGAVLSLIFSLRGEPLVVTLLIGLPFIGCGVICMALKKRLLLWCGWYLWLLLEFCQMLMQVDPYFFVRPLVMLPLLTVLLLATGWSFRNSIPKTARGRLWLALVCLALALSCWGLFRAGYHYYGVFDMGLSQSENDRRQLLGELLLRLSLIPAVALVSAVLASILHALGYLGTRARQVVSHRRRKETP